MLRQGGRKLLVNRFNEQILVVKYVHSHDLDNGYYRKLATLYNKHYGLFNSIKIYAFLKLAERSVQKPHDSGVFVVTTLYSGRM